MQLPAVYLCRDDIVVAAREQPEDLCLDRHAGRFIKGINGLGFACFCLSPSSGETRLRDARFDRRISELLRTAGAKLTAVCSISDRVGDPSRVETILLAADAHRVDLRRSYVVATDAAILAAGRSAGLGTVRLGDAADAPGSIRPDHVAADFGEVLPLLRSLNVGGPA